MGYGVIVNNPFDLLGDENEDPAAAAARASAANASKEAELKKAAEKEAAEKAASKPAGGRGNAAPARGRGNQGRGGRGGGDRPARDDNNQVTADGEDSGYQGRGAGRGGRGGRGGGRGNRGYGDGDEGRPRRREFDRRSGTGRGDGRGSETKRGGAGKGNWGSSGDLQGDSTAAEAATPTEGKPADAEGEAGEAAETEAAAPPPEEDNEMTLEEFQKAEADKRAAFKAQFAKTAVRTVDTEVKNMTAVVRVEDPESEVFFVGKSSDDKGKAKAKNEKKTKETLESGFFIKEEKAYGEREGRGRGGRGGRGRGEGRRTGGGRGGGRGYAGNAPNITDASAFPSLG